MSNKELLIPPLKYQGTKTKLIPNIKKLAELSGAKNLIEPFMGSGVVGFNLGFENTLMNDINPHVINLYKTIQNKNHFTDCLAAVLKENAIQLRRFGETYYYEMREKFNKHKKPYTFMFVNRTCFNGIMRFNKKGEFNVPYSKADFRLSESYITKVSDSAFAVRELIQSKNFTFTCNNFEESILAAGEDDLIYCDPPYIERNNTYFDGWDINKETYLFELLSETKAKFIFSTWDKTKHGKNEFYYNNYLKKFNVITQEHFYGLGAKPESRYGVTEALVTNF